MITYDARQRHARATSVTEVQCKCCCNRARLLITEARFDVLALIVDARSITWRSIGCWWTSLVVVVVVLVVAHVCPS